MWKACQHVWRVLCTMQTKIHIFLWLLDTICLLLNVCSINSENLKFLFCKSKLKSPMVSILDCLSFNSGRRLSTSIFFKSFCLLEIQNGRHQAIYFTIEPYGNFIENRSLWDPMGICTNLFFSESTKPVDLICSMLILTANKKTWKICLLITFFQN
jgi:hypothetical protein